MIYKITFTTVAEKDFIILKRNEPKAYKKLTKFLIELASHPETGTGHPKPLGGNRIGQWSRKITDKHRLIYKIEKEKITVLVLSAFGHYDDK